MEPYKFQTYSDAFAIVYDLHWGHFTMKFTVPLIEFLEREHAISPDNSSVCDLCCGTGQTTNAFAEKGYRVQAVDRSGGMLNRSKIKNTAFIDSGTVTVSEQDAETYVLPTKVEVTVSLFDSLNHLNSMDALYRCFCSVAGSTVPGGLFIFDLNTRKGLRGWNAIDIDESDEWFVVNRGVFSPEMERAYTAISGFVFDQGTWRRFSEVMYNTAFDLKEVGKLLMKAGWGKIGLFDPRDMSRYEGNPEELNRVFFLAEKARTS